MALKLRSLSLNLPFGLGGVDVEVSEAEVRAAWELYVEYATRITTVRLEPGAGSARETLTSVYSLFATTREVLRPAGPEIADGPTALGPLAIDILNAGLRPFLVRWHTELRILEQQAAVSGAPAGGELPADRRAVFDAELDELRAGLDDYVTALAQIAGITPR